MTDYTAVIQAELDKLDELKSRKSQREATIRAIADARVRGTAETAVFGSTFAGTRTIGQRTYYDKEKDWYHNALFQEVLERVSDLYRQRDNEEREAAEEAARKKRHDERVALIRAGKGKLAELLRDMETAGASPAQVASFMRTVFDEERSEFDELPTQRMKQEITGADGGPIPIAVVNVDVERLR